MKKYQIAFEVCKRFKSDLLKIKDPHIFESLILHFAEDMGRYEAKIGLALTMMPFMDRSVVGRLMKVIEGVLSYSAPESMMRNNINPLRCGMMLFRLIRDAKDIFSYS